MSNEADNHSPLVLDYAPPDPKPADAGNVGQFGKAAVMSSFFATLVEAALAAYGGADPAAVVGCVYIVVGFIMALVGTGIAAVTVDARKVVLGTAAQIRSQRACVTAGVLYPIFVLGSGHLLSAVGIEPTDRVPSMLLVALVVLAIAAGWWMVQRKQS